jgi:hypothetical protein
VIFKNPTCLGFRKIYMSQTGRELGILKNWGSHRWIRRVLSSGIQRLIVRWKPTDVSKKHVTSMYRVQEQINFLLYSWWFLAWLCPWNLKIETTWSSGSSTDYKTLYPRIQIPSIQDKVQRVYLEYWSKQRSMKIHFKLQQTLLRIR